MPAGLWLAAALAAVAGSAGAGDLGDEKVRQAMDEARLRVLAPRAAGPPPVSDAAKRMRLELLEQGEAALARADVENALQAFERAASILHMADTEMGLVRAYMQGGEYRRAVAFVAHTAGAHREVPGATALYAWLLNLGGHGDHARRLLAEAHERFALHPIVDVVAREIESGRPLATGPMLDTPARLAPYGAIGVPAGARVAGSGWLFDGGRRALVPIATLRGAARVWVRNGLGQVAPASVEKREATSQVAVLRLETALPLEEKAHFAPRDPFPGSVAFAVEYVDSRDATPRWPILRSGFLGQSLSDGTERKLGLDMPPGPRGGPVFDVAGRLAGIALPGARGADRLLPASGLRRIVGEGNAPLAMTPSVSVPQVSTDLIYESALRSTVQVIAAR